jgi:hypothetical protein
MSASLPQVHAKAKAFVDSLRKLPAAQRARHPGAKYGREYATLRKLALQIQPAIDVQLLGPTVTISTKAGRKVCDATFAEVETYARQIMEQLGLRPDNEGMAKHPHDPSNNRSGEGDATKKLQAD